jgi:hypothetical protein
MTTGLRILYKSGYKYQLAEDYTMPTGLEVVRTINTGFILLDPFGNLTIRAGYAWDGPSGPTFDTRNFMRGSLVHDAVYQLMREGHMPASYRQRADQLLRQICRQDGMSAVRAWWVYWAVRAFAAPCVDVRHVNPVQAAPW